jgi:hypothetical protein
MSLVLVRFEDRSLSSKAKNQNAVGGQKRIHLTLRATAC